MKYIKLIILIALMGGLYYVVFIKPNITKDSLTDDTETPNLMADMTRQIEQEWDSVSKWDSNVYNASIAQIDVKKTELEFQKKGNHKTLVDYTNEIVCNKLMAFLDSALRQENCTQKNINAHQKNINEFLKANSSIDKNDERIDTAFRRIKIYNAALRFSRQTFSLQPQFDINDNNWTPKFIEYRDSILTKRDEHVKFLTTAELYHITEVRNALTSSVEKKLQDAREQYALNLSAKIVAAFHPLERTLSNYEKYRQIADVFYEYDDGELKDNGSLIRARNKFKEDVEESERLKQGQSQII